MIEEIKGIKNEKSDWQKFGIIFGLILLIIAGFLFSKEHESFQIFLAFGVAFFTAGITIPFIIKPIYWLWMLLGTIFGWVMTRVILSFLFYLLFTPIGLLLKLFGKQFLDLRWDKSKESYWNNRDSKHFIKEQYEKQF